jgi:hypothetical protein
MPFIGPADPDEATPWVDLADVKAQLEKATDVDNEELQGYIDRACAMIVERCGPIVDTDFTETYDGEGQRTILLDNFPVTAVNSVSVAAGLSALVLAAAGGTTGNTSGYRFKADTGELTRIGGVWPCGYDNVSVFYTAGRGTTAPEPVVGATLLLVQHLWQTTKVGRGGGRPGTTGGGTTTSTYVFPNRVEEMLFNFLKPPKVA